MKTTDSVNGAYNSKNIILKSTGASSVNITTAASGNTVTAKALTITGLSAADKNYNGTTAVSVTGTPTYSGLVNGESFSVSGTVTWAFADATVGNGKTLTRTGSFLKPSFNYSITQPVLTASITAVAPTVTTSAASSIASTSANSGGNVTSTGGVTVTRRGLIYSTGAITDTTSTTGGDKIIDASGGSGVYSLSITGLTLGTTYHIRAFAVNSIGVSYGDDLTFATLAGSPPSISSPTVSNISNTSATIGSMVTADGGSSLTVVGTLYGTAPGLTASSNAASITPLPNLNEAFSQTRSSLSAQTLYYFAAYATNANVTGISTESSFRTLSNPPTAQASSFTATTVSGTQINLSWATATYPASGATNTGYVIISAVAPNTPSLSNGNAAAPSAGANSSIVTFSLNDTATSASSTGLLANTSYNYVIIPYTWDGTNAATYNYLVANAVTARGTTAAARPTAAPSNLSFTNTTCNGMTLTWKKAVGGADGYLVLRSTDTTPNTNPTSLISYSLNTAISNATVVYAGADSTVILSGLSDTTNYYYKIYSYNGSGSNISYLTSSILSGNKSTSSITTAPVLSTASNIYSNTFTANWSGSSSCVNSYSIQATSIVDSFENNQLKFFTAAKITGSGNPTFYLGSNTGGSPATSY
jgi:hypothetical protein